MLSQYSKYLADRRDQTLSVTTFIAKPNPTVLDRICLILYLVSFSCAGIVLVMFMIRHSQYNSTQYRLETEYLHWKTPIPAVSVCENPNNTSLNDIVARTVISTAEQTQVTKFYKGLLRPTDEGFCAGCNEVCRQCPKDGYKHILDKMLTMTCEGLFKSCSWNGKLFHCCKEFQLLMTRHAKCYTLNSRHMPQSENALMFTVSETWKRGHLEMTFNSPVQVYVHDRGDISFMRKQLALKNPLLDKLPKRVDIGQIANIEYTLREVQSDSTARLLSILQRNCTLPEEQKLRYYSRYSLTACRTECKIINQMKLCNCTHHLTAHSGLPACNYKGLQCLQHFFWKQTNERKTSLRKTKVKCNCMPECEFTEINFIRNTIDDYGNDQITASVKLNSLPSERLTLHARVNTLEMFVGLACISRLFTSCSLVQIAQITYYIVKHLYLRVTQRFQLDLERAAKNTSVIPIRPSSDE